jgi:hypothetical protein
MDQPSVGRIVHYVAYGTPGGEFPAGVCRAAVITEVTAAHDSLHVPGEAGYPRVSVCVVNPTGLFFNQRIPYSADKTPGSWHWPERV